LKSNFGLPQATIEQLTNYFAEKPEISKVLIFGSRANGTYCNGSDVDFALFMENKEGFFRIKAELDELPTPYKFDVVDYDTLQESIKKSVDKEGLIFYSK